MRKEGSFTPPAEQKLAWCGCYIDPQKPVENAGEGEGRCKSHACRSLRRVGGGDEAGATGWKVASLLDLAVTKAGLSWRAARYPPQPVPQRQL